MKRGTIDITSGETSPGIGGICPYLGTIPKVVLCPKIPLKLAGMRTEPPKSLPNSRGVNPADKAAAEPPDEPPGVRDKSQRLFVVP